MVDDLGISGGLIGGLVSKYMPKVLDWVSNKINNWFGGQSSVNGVNPVVYMNAQQSKAMVSHKTNPASMSYAVSMPTTQIIYPEDACGLTSVSPQYIATWISPETNCERRPSTMQTRTSLVTNTFQYDLRTN